MTDFVVQPLNVVRTNYGTGPYIIETVDGPCTCAEYLRHIDGDDSPSEPHFHLTCRLAPGAIGGGGNYWLNGYRLDGTSVWSNDRLELVGAAAGQLGLFA